MFRSSAAIYLGLVAALLVAASSLSACSSLGPSRAQEWPGAHLAAAVESYMAELPGPSPKLFLTTRIYDRNGILLGEFWDEGRRYWVPLDRIAPALRAATIATEDKTFYTNPGVDWAAIVRAVLQNTAEGEIVSGASTITQQLARNIAFTYEERISRSLDRKMREAALAQELTSRFSKDEILEMYLNVVYYGHLAYGAEAAARTYFGKSAAELTLAESALLAALPQSPAELDPLVPGNLERAKARQGLVLALMARNRMITPEEAAAAYAEPLHFRTESAPEIAPHFLVYVRQLLEAQYGKNVVARGGLTVITTLDARLQQIAQETVRRHVEAVRERYNLTNAALVALKPGTGEILAMVGSIDFYSQEIDGQVNVTIRPRQPGSAIKPVLYALAFTRGFSPASLVWDIPSQFPLDNGTVYEPRNYDGKFHGPVRLRQALANSYNVPAVKLLDQVGVPAMLEMARAMGIRGLNQPPSHYGLSLTLGGGEVTLLDLTTAYATLANAGGYVPPVAILRVADRAGRVIVTYEPPAPQPVLDPRVAYLVSSILSDNEARIPMFGANSPLRLSRPAAVKTGTTTDWKDNWTVGYTPYLAVGVWAGNNSGAPMRHTTGLTGAAPIWHDFMEAVFADPTLEAVVRRPDEPLDFPRPEGLVEAPICDLMSLNFGPDCPVMRSELFLDPARPITIGLSPEHVLPTAEITTSLSITQPIDPAWTVRSVLRLAPVQGPDMPAPLLCATELGGEPIAVIRVPEDPEEAQRAREWAAQAGIPADPPPCEGQVVEVMQGVIASAEIVFPQPGSLITGPVDIIGSAVFDPQQIQFYKVEFGYGENPSEWITMGQLHYSPVVNGWLETWYADSLPAGPYALRVVLVKWDGNFLATPPTPVYVQH
ncbi:MAG: penicillin-binding protein 1C [Anaerolineae bacterium]|nr:penicillin-binding protein 1C [Anaerolineae bacterium]MDW8098081.1 penicillin-binding protein 1C [Anaerolineae bacterium]